MFFREEGEKGEAMTGEGGEATAWGEREAMAGEEEEVIDSTLSEFVPKDKAINIILVHNCISI